MKSKEELIKSIHIVQSNFDYCSSNHMINGTLYIEIRRIMQEYAQQKALQLIEDLEEEIEQARSKAKRAHTPLLTASEHGVAFGCTLAITKIKTIFELP